MKAYQGFANLIRQRRRELGLNLVQVADYVGWSLPYLSELERGVKQPPQARVDVGVPNPDLVKLSHVLQVDLKILMNEASLSRRSVEIDLDGASAVQRKLAVLLARRFDGGLTDEEAQKIIYYLGQEVEGGD